jgi:hypothetical protein
MFYDSSGFMISHWGKCMWTPTYKYIHGNTINIFCNAEEIRQKKCNVYFSVFILCTNTYIVPCLAVVGHDSLNRWCHSISPWVGAGLVAHQPHPCPCINGTCWLKDRHFYWYYRFCKSWGQKIVTMNYSEIVFKVNPAIFCQPFPYIMTGAALLWLCTHLC